MKKILVSCALICVASVSHAQLRVNSNGNVSIQSASTAPLSALTISGSGDKDFAIHYLGSKCGILCKSEGGNFNWGNAGEFRSMHSNNNFYVGAKCDATSTNAVEYSTGRAFGVIGGAGYATEGWNYGVFGKLFGTHKGAAVYGTSDPLENGIYMSKRYAGYFNGEVGVNGDLTVNGAVTGVIISPAVNTTSQAKELNTGSISDGLSGLKAMSYYMTTPTITYTNQSDTAIAEPKITKIEAQNYAKMHYALSADDVEAAYPDLVYEQEDGSKGVNYIEMIPLLVQSVNELKAEVATLRSENNRLKATANGEKTDKTLYIDISGKNFRKNVKQ